MSLLVVHLLFASATLSVASSEYIRACYFTNWSQYRKGFPGHYTLTNHYEDGLCTHIIYSFAQVSNVGGSYIITKYEENDESWGYKQLQQIKARDPKLKTLLAIGGWNQASITFPHMVATKSMREIFIQTTIEYLKTHKFDGLDLDWEYPAKRGSPAIDKQRFTMLCKELKEAFSKHGLLVTAAVAANQNNVDRSYEILEISKHLDFINLMAYDLHGTWEHQTGHQTDTNPSLSRDQLSVINSVNHWLSKGMDSKKLVLGLASYGRVWKLKNPCSNWGLGAPGTKDARKGKSTREASFLAYYEICDISWKNHVCTSKSSTMAPYGTDGRDFIGYDDEESITYKVNNIMKKKNLGGFMFWALDLDDFKDMCGTGKTYPLIKAATAAALNKPWNVGKCNNVRTKKCVPPPPPPTLPPAKNGCKVNPKGPWTGQASMDKWCKNIGNCPGIYCGDTYPGCKTCRCVCGKPPPTPPTQPTKPTKPTKHTKPQPGGKCIVPKYLSKRKRCYLNPDGLWAGKSGINNWCKTICPIDHTCEPTMCCCDGGNEELKSTKIPKKETTSTTTKNPHVATTTKKPHVATTKMTLSTAKPTKRITKAITKTTRMVTTQKTTKTKVTRRPVMTKTKKDGKCLMPKGRRRNCRSNKKGPWGSLSSIDQWCKMTCLVQYCMVSMCCCDSY